MRILLRDLQVVRQAQRFRNTGCSGTPDILLRDDLDRGCRFDELFRMARHGGHFTFIKSSTLSCLSSPILGAALSATACAVQLYTINVPRNQFRLIIPATITSSFESRSCCDTRLRQDCTHQELGQTLKHETCEYVLRLFSVPMLARYL